VSFNSVIAGVVALAGVRAALGAGTRRGLEIVLRFVLAGFLVAGFAFLGAAPFAGALTEASSVTGWSMMTGAASAVANSDLAGAAAAAA
jgi:hypothetical protein